MNKSVIIIIIAVMSVFFSCTISFEMITPVSSYERLTLEEKKDIVLLTNEDTLPAVFDTTLFYAVTAEHLKTYMQHDSCLIYFWNPYCHGELCLSPVIFQQYCNTHNYRFILVIDARYSAIKEATEFRSQLEMPMLMINFFCYNDKGENFKKTLFKDQLKHLKRISSRYWLYKDGIFSNFEKELDIDELVNPNPMKTKVIK
jgi:hypothetical protein